MSSAKKYGLMVLLLILALYIVPLGARPMFVPDEARYAEVPREMIASGDWVSPHLNGLRYFEKPALGYWATAGSIMLFGANNFAIRLPSALSVALTAFIILVITGSEAKKDETSAPLAALIFLTSLEVYAVGTFCVLDSLLAFFLTGTMASFYLASIATPGSRQEKKYLMFSGIFCGLAFLTKGFLAFAVPILAIVPFLLTQRRFADIFRMAWLPMLTALLVALPWSVLIHLREPQFWHYFFWIEHVQRFLAENAQHKKTFWYFFLSAPPMFLPWIFLVPAAVTGLFSNTVANRTAKRDISPLASFCICWFIFPFLFFSVSNGKLLTYILPCFPPFAILLSLGLHRVLKRGRFRSFQLGTITATLLHGALLVAIIAFLSATHFFGFDIALPENRIWKWLMAVNGLFVMVLFFIAAIRSRKVSQKILLFGLAPVLILFLANFIMPDLTLESKAPVLLLKRHEKDVTPASIIFSGEKTVQAACWYYKRNDIYMVESAGELEYGLEYDQSGSRLLKLKEVSRLIAEHPGRSVLIASVKHYENWKKFLPAPSLLDNSGVKGYVFVKY
ncbi:MAG: phospholipid carrier-dependent glycosyltransferase [Proteobacteria bacterium]|nr:phospholipid carrier-dependent glycosyltransferase [Pseudomonadota bacterium]MBU4296003.1 phospholipid carrier-dependent glycosyltransferase [Pseudomonadota bacterium]MCG2747254.1 phospholipid carrier-dependent glycosyltransferase [Desulfobulbaceae bacterium]